MSSSNGKNSGGGSRKSDALERKRVDYRDLLASILNDKLNEKKVLSIRSLAKRFEIDPSHLLRVLQGTRHLSPQSARRVALELFDQADSQEAFVKMVILAGKENKKQKQSVFDETSDSVLLGLEEFALVSQWYHLAILELFYIPKLKKNVASIARYLGIEASEAENALSRLKKLGLIESDSRGRLHRRKGAVFTTNEVPSAAIRQFHYSMGSKALEALEKQSIENRHFTAKTVSISKSDLPKIKNAAKRFLRSIETVVDRSSASDSLYQLNVQLFELGKGE